MGSNLRGKNLLLRGSTTLKGRGGSFVKVREANFYLIEEILFQKGTDVQKSGYKVCFP